MNPNFFPFKLKKVCTEFVSIYRKEAIRLGVSEKKENIMLKTGLLNEIFVFIVGPNQIFHAMRNGKNERTKVSKYQKKRRTKEK